MKKIKKTILAFILCITCSLICSCSTVGSGKYLVPESKQKGIEYYRRDWSSDNELSVMGRFMPKLYRYTFNEGISYVVYPIIIDLRAWMVGPICLPIIPAWWWAKEPEDTNNLHRVKIVWFGDLMRSQKIWVTHQDINGTDLGQPEILYRGTNELVCSYFFKDQITDKSKLVLTNSAGQGTAPMSFLFKREIGFAPVISISGGTARRRWENKKAEQSRVAAEQAEQREREQGQTRPEKRR